MSVKRPVIFLTFANDRVDGMKYLRNLPKEQKLIRDALERAKLDGLCEYVERANATADDIFDVFQNPDYRNRIAVFHFGGHANSYQLLLESEEGGVEAAEARGLAAFLGQQRGLQLVFLNGCSTRQQTEELLESNVSAVIATSQSINDWAAMKFAARFYRGLAGGANIEKAYKEAEAAVRTASKGDSFRNAYAVDAPQVDGWPWDLRVRKGAEITVQWNLPESVGDPLFPLPSLKHADLPEKPFRHLLWFTRADAEVFFGRGRQIRELYDRVTDPDTPPITLFYGQSGVGKSSVLEAGLMPRLEASVSEAGLTPHPEPSHEVRYLRRNQQLGLLGTLNQSFLNGVGEEPLIRTWFSVEAELKRPLVVILDQVEEVYTRPDKNRPEELADFLSALEALFASSGARPRGKLLLSFRKEWLPEIEQKLKERKLARAKIFLERLDREGIIESITGVARDERLRKQYGLMVEDGLAGVIADDLLEDQDSPIAPTLQVLLTKMWDEATKINQSLPRFDRNLYATLKNRGILLGDFLDQQLAELRKRNGEFIESGLALDLLAFHTTPLGTAEQHTAEELSQEYEHRKDALPVLVGQYKDLYLLSDPVSDGGNPQAASSTRLAHDTLAPLIRLRFNKSVAPGQIARRLLENRSAEWQDGRVGTPLDERDLKTVENGERGMRSRTPEEERLVAASREERERRRRNKRILQSAAVALVLIVVGAFSVGWYLQRERQRLQAEGDRLRDMTKARTLADFALQKQMESQHELMALLARQAFLFNKLGQGAILDQVDAALRAVEKSPLFPPATRDEKNHISLLTFSSDGKKLALRDSFKAARTSMGEPWKLTLRNKDRQHSIHIARDSRQTAPKDSTLQIALLAFNQAQRILASNIYTADARAAIESAENVQLWEWPDAASVPRPAPNEAGEELLIEAPTRVLSHEKGTSVHSLVFSPDGETLAVGTDKGEVYLWKWRQPNTRPTVLRHGQADPVTEMEFSPDGETLAAGVGVDKVLLWKPGRPQETPTALHFKKDTSTSESLPSGKTVTALAFSPDGNKLAGCQEKIKSFVDVWDLQQTGEASADYLPHEVKLMICNALAFSPDGNRLAAGFAPSVASSGSTLPPLLLWDLRKTYNPPSSLEPSFLGYANYIVTISFSDDGEVIASLYNYGQVLTRFSNVENLANAICGRVTRNLSIHEWGAYVGWEAGYYGYRCTCPNFPAGERAPPCQK